MSKPLYVVTGANGNVGKALALDLLARGERVRVVLRTDAAADEWRKRGADVRIADLRDRDALAQALEGAAAVFALNPPAHRTPDLFEECAAIAASFAHALRRADVRKAVVLSSVGAEAERGAAGVVYTAHMLEEALRGVCAATAFLRAGSFFENLRYTLPVVLQTGTLSAFHATDLRVPSIATRDIGALGAELMVTEWTGTRIVELFSQEVSPAETASILSDLLGRPIQAMFVPFEQQGAVFAKMGMPEVTAKAWIEMNQGINSKAIRFSGKHETVRGKTSAREALAAIAATKS